MQEKRFKRIEWWLGLALMLLSSVVYILSMEKSASLWDCPEFIATFSKLEVGHPPGAPFYMLVYNFFSTFFLGDPSKIAIAGNTLSSLMSGATVMLLFLSISHLLRRSLLLRGKEASEAYISQRNAYMAWGAGIVGALMYAFSDTFWFSAVESEVYAFSSLFTALVFYLMLRWEAVAESQTSDRWLVGIAYLMGLSVGVHLLNLLCIPAMALIYYYKRSQKKSWKGALLAILMGFALIAIIMFGIIQGVPEVAGYFDLFAVNTLGLPFNTGLVVYLLLISTLLVLSYLESIRQPLRMRRLQLYFVSAVILLGIPFMGNGIALPLIIISLLFWWVYKHSSFTARLANLATLCLALFFIGLSTYGVILIRANSDIPMNQNTPSDVFALRKYLSRDQYGSTPLIYGKTYASVPKRDANGSAVSKEIISYRRGSIEEHSKKRAAYVKQKSIDLVYRSDMNMLFPRMYNNTQDHYPYGYQMWGNVSGRPVSYSEAGQVKTAMVPTFTENLRYFFNYQLNYMYWRYFMWNFSGRQNDLQGQGEISRGNWCTGIPFLDRLILGPMSAEYKALMKENKGYNRYFMLPFILGILGIAFLLSAKGRGKQTFLICLLLFFMTGIAIVLYLNQPPFQVRERDYAYAGSFYAFSIWVGMGVAFITELIETLALKGKQSSGAALAATLLCLCVPALVLAENWDDHNRNGRTLAADFGSNYLESCQENGILFCNGDNDTFPLWYAQEVEGKRRDLRVCNTSYLQADWYIDQMKRDSYQSKALPISWPSSRYAGDQLNIIYLLSVLDKEVELSTALDFAASTDKRKKRIPELFSKDIDYIPSKKFYLPYNEQELIRNGMVYPSDTSLMDPQRRMHINFEQKNYLGKHEAIILNLLSQNAFRRPMYYCFTVSSSEYLNLQDHFRQTGTVYQIMPFRTVGKAADVDCKRMYDNVMHKFKWGGADRADVYMDENSRRMAETYRSEVFAKLANALMEKGQKDKAVEVLKKGLSAIRPEAVPYDRSSVPMIESLFRAGMLQEALPICKEMIRNSFIQLDYFSGLDRSDLETAARDVDENLWMALTLAKYCQQWAPDYYQQIHQPLSRYMQSFGIEKRS